MGAPEGRAPTRILKDARPRNTSRTCYAATSNIAPGSRILTILVDDIAVVLLAGTTRHGRSEPARPPATA